MPFWAHTDYSSSEGAEDESDGDDDYDNHDGDDNGSLELDDADLWEDHK